MVGPTHRQSSLFFTVFQREAALIKDDLLEPIDQLLDDPELVDLVREGLSSRSARSRSTGRRGMAPDRALRCMVLKHLKGWSFRQLERELRSSLVYRRFTRFDHDPIPDFATFSRTFAALGEEVTHQIHLEVVACAQRDQVAQGRRLRTDTTVVESNVHHPTDSTLLADGMRVLTRGLGRLSEECSKGAIKVVNHARAVKHRVLEIYRAAKSPTDEARQNMQNSYGKLVGLASGAVRQARRVIQDLKAGRLPITGSWLNVWVEQAQLEHFVPLVDQVIHQTKERVFHGNTHVAGKLVSLFEEHTQVIRKGKPHKPTEFGRLVRIDEVENGIVSNYDIKDGNPSDQLDFVPAVSQHKEIFGHAPHLATADRGFHSAKNEREAQVLGVKRVAVPARGRLSASRAQLQKERWFKQAQRWRAGIESRIATLKNRFGMARARYKGDGGFKRYVGWSIIANNLVSMARVRQRRKMQQDASQVQQAA